MGSKLRKLDSSSKVLPFSVNGAIEDSDIANVFAEKYQNLYSSVLTNQDEIDKLYLDISDEIISHEYVKSCYGYEIISCNLMKWFPFSGEAHPWGPGVRTTCKHVAAQLVNLLIN